MNLELLAMRWLWLEKNCHYVLRERSPRYSMGEPDILGVTASRYLIEIEIKRSMSDFRADAKKWCRLNRDGNLKRIPKQIYYLVTLDMIDRCKQELPAWAGLMRPAAGTCQVIENAPINSESERLTVKECVKMTRLITNYAMGCEQKLDSLFCRYREGHVPYICSDASITHYEI
jgi:hypothetical protein